jgi:hypothetical protein
LRHGTVDARGIGTLKNARAAVLSGLTRQAEYFLQKRGGLASSLIEDVPINLQGRLRAISGKAGGCLGKPDTQVLEMRAAVPRLNEPLLICRH